ncbi:MAG: hypothetical protein FJW36_12795 [Acidobacteria bacterium]|nr:hypothetical protein [Acidobacteriota bacterium]
MNRIVGTLCELRRYPVKSMAAESLQSAVISFHGFAGDRRWAFIRPGAQASGFPWLTIREKPDLWHYQPSFLNPDDVESSKIRVTTPTGEQLDLTDPALAARLGEGVHLIKQYSGVFDTFPLSLSFRSKASPASLPWQPRSCPPYASAPVWSSTQSASICFPKTVGQALSCESAPSA